MCQYAMYLANIIKLLQSHCAQYIVKKNFNFNLSICILFLFLHLDKFSCRKITFRKLHNQSTDEILASRWVDTALCELYSALCQMLTGENRARHPVFQCLICNKKTMVFLHENDHILRRISAIFCNIFSRRSTL